MGFKWRSCLSVKRNYSDRDRFVPALVLAGVLVGCSSARTSGPADDVVTSEVTNGLNSVRPTTWSGTVADNFEISAIAVKDRLVNEKDATVVVTLGPSTAALSGLWIRVSC